MKLSKKSFLLYAVTDRRWLKEKSLEEAVKNAIEGGATFIQLREKDLDETNFLQEAKKIKKLCQSYNIPLVINDSVDIAKKCACDGVHLGQEDMTLSKVRQILGADKIIGVSCQTVKQAIAAEKGGADYLGIGAVFPTASKNDAQTVAPEMLRKICQAVKIPVVAIGGITAENVCALKASGICGIAVVSAIFAQKDIKQATTNLKKKLCKH